MNLLYLCSNHASGYIERSSAEEINEKKYLIFDSIDENKSYLKNTKMLLMELEI